MTKPLSSNKELYDYLVSLGNLLAERGSLQLAESVRLAARTGTGLSTEFIGESRIALQGVLDAEQGLLQAVERHELQSILAQVDFALRR